MKSVFILTLFASLKLCAVTFLIDQPGTYNLGIDIVEIGTNVVQITASNVTLDLGGHTLAGGINGIVINPGLSFVTIKNGKIASITNDGISIGQSCANIILDGLTIVQCGHNAITANSGLNGSFMTNNIIGFSGSAGLSVATNCSSIRVKELKISSCSGPAIELLGTSSVSEVKNSFFENITTVSCALSATFTHVIHVENGDNIIFANLGIFSSGNNSTETKLIEFSQSSQCNIRGALLSANSAGSLIGVSLKQTESMVIKEVSVINSCATFGDLTGFLLSNTANNNLFSVCNVGTSSATFGHARGFNLTNASDGLVFDTCGVIGLIAADVTGFDFHYDTTGLFNLLTDCTVLRNLALTGTVVAYSINNAHNGTIRDSIGSYNVALSGIAVGLLFTGTGGDNWQLNNDRFIHNVGVDDANSYGIFVESGADNLFIKNIAFDNGTTAANQMSGVPVGSVTQLDPTNINTATSAWTNIVVTV